jgi:hypothetical protein
MAGFSDNGHLAMPNPCASDFEAQPKKATKRFPASSALVLPQNKNHFLNQNQNFPLI